MRPPGTGRDLLEFFLRCGQDGRVRYRNRSQRKQDSYPSGLEGRSAPRFATTCQVEAAGSFLPLSRRSSP
jgi:hypothetical protein